METSEIHDETKNVIFNLVKQRDWIDPSKISILSIDIIRNNSCQTLMVYPIVNTSIVREKLITTKTDSDIFVTQSVECTPQYVISCLNGFGSVFDLCLILRAILRNSFCDILAKEYIYASIGKSSRGFLEKMFHVGNRDLKTLAGVWNNSRDVDVVTADSEYESWKNSKLCETPDNSRLLQSLVDGNYAIQ